MANITDFVGFFELVGNGVGIGVLIVEPSKLGIGPVRQMTAEAGQGRLVLRGAGIVNQMAFIAEIGRCDADGSANKAADLLKELAVTRYEYTDQN